MIVAPLASWLPVGYALVQGAPFLGEPYGDLGFKQTPVTNAEFGDVGRNHFILLDHNWETGETRLNAQGLTVKDVVDPELVPEGINFDQGGILVNGSRILLKMGENPSAKYGNNEERIFTGANQPVVSITYFHAKTWCFLKTLASGGEFTYDLPTDAQYEYVASDRGTKEYGTETGTLHKGEKKLAHIDEFHEGKGTPVAVDDARYVQDLPFGVQTTGNVWRWIRFNADFKRQGDCFFGPYGLRGGGWGDYPSKGRATFRSGNRVRPDYSYCDTGFSPVVIRQTPLKPTGPLETLFEGINQL